MYQVVESEIARPQLAYARYQERVSSVADLKMLYLFKNALRRLQEEVPCEDYGMWLDTENRVLRFHTAGKPYNQPAATLRHAAEELDLMMAAMSF